MRRGAGPAGATVALLAALLPACVAPAYGKAGAPSALYVANSQDGTVSQLDSATGRRLGPPLPAGPSPWQIAPGPDGSLLVLSIAPQHAGQVTHVRRSGSGWTTRQIVLEHAPQDAILASHGGRYAAVAYRLSPADAVASAAGCRLALLDTAAGTVARTHSVCAAHETISSLAFEDGPAGPIAYLGLRDWASHGAGGSGAGTPGGRGGRDRVIALDADRGAVQAVLLVAGRPRHLTLAPAPGRTSTTLYAVVIQQDEGHDPPTVYHTRLLGLNPASLEVESERPLGFVPRRLAVAPDGDHAYALLDHAVVRLPLADAAGADALLAVLPGRGYDLAVVLDRVYVSNAYGSELWAVDARREGPVRPIPVGGRPTGLMPGRSASARPAG
jgi:DNA-binding beta-propeller fold protein YncE